MNGAPGGVAALLAADRGRLLSRLEAAARRMRHRTDHGASHDVRVATRRLDALLDVWRALLPVKRRRRARRALRALRRALGRARELRVDIDLLRDRLPRTPPAARAAIGVVIERWERSLTGVEKDAASSCRPRAVREIRRRIDRAFPHLPDEPVTGMQLAATGRARVLERRRRAVTGVRRAGEHQSDERLHAARVAIKRWRYAIERIEVADPGPADPVRETLADFQSRLGRIQDLAVLRNEIRAIAARLERAGIADGAAAFMPLIEDLEGERAQCVEDFMRAVAAADLGDAPVLPIRPASGSA